MSWYIHNLILDTAWEKVARFNVGPNLQMPTETKEIT